MTQLAQTYQAADAPVWVVTSGGLIAEIIRRVCHMPVAQFIPNHHLIANASVTRLRCMAGGFVLSSYNDTAHFETDIGKWLTWR